MAITVGSVEVEVVPSTRRFAEILRRDVTGQADQIGREIGSTVGDRIADGIQRGVDDGFDGSEQTSKREGRKSGQAYGGAFAQAVSRAIAGALSALPPLQIGAAGGGASQEIKEITAELESLRDVRIGVDLDAGQALERLAVLQARLERLQADTVDIDVRVDSGKAIAELAGLKLAIGKLDGSSVSLGGGGGGGAGGLGGIATAAETATGSVSGLGAAVLVLVAAMVPIAGVAAGAFGAIATGAAAALSGVLVLVLAFHGIADAVKATGKAQETAARDAEAAASKQLAATTAVVSANRSLANAQRQARDAQAAVATTAARAAASVASANAAYARLVRDLAAAQRAAQQAQEDLTQARLDERRALHDLETEQAHTAVDIQQATLDLQTQTVNLQNTLADPTSTEAQRRQAQIDYDQATLRLQDLNQQQADLADQKTKADQAGVDGSDAVQAAVQRVVDSNQAVIDAQAAVGTSAANVAQAQVDAVASVAAANQRVVDSQLDVVDAQRSVAKANADAARSASELSTNAQAARDAMDKLSPAGQTFATFVATTLVPAFHQLVDAAQAAVLPGLQTALTALLPLLGPFAEFVGTIGNAIAGAFAAALVQLQDPTWTAFFDYIAQTAGPAIQGISAFMLNIGEGIAGMVTALGPFTQTLGSWLLTLSQRFAEWAGQLGSDSNFQQFLAWLQANGPHILDIVLNVAEAIGRLLIALAPTGLAILETFNLLAEAINSLPLDQLAWIVTNLGSMWGIILAIRDIALPGVAEGFREIGDAGAAAWNSVVAAARAVWNWFARNWSGLARILYGPFEAAGRWIAAAFNGLLQWFASFPSTVGGIFQHIWDGVVQAFRWALNTIIGWWNSLDFTVPAISVAGHTIGGFTLGMPDIPYFAQGGIVDRPTLGVLGEAGPEAVIPLSTLRVPGFGAGQANQGAPQVRVFIGDTELTDIVRTEVVAFDDDQARQITYGRRA